MSPLARIVLPLLIAALSHAPDVGADERVHEALDLCAQAAHLEGDRRDLLLVRGVALAEAAVAADAANPEAQFALFCTQARQLETAGVSFGSMLTVRRLQRTIDRALELDPHYVDALVAKAGMLRRLPRFFGGDRGEARRCLERALALQPTHPVARRYAVEDGIPVDSPVVFAAPPAGPEAGWQ